MKKRETRLCDNIYCWNLIELPRWRIGKVTDHHFCDQTCYGIWLKSNSTSKRPDVAKRISESLRGNRNPMKDPIIKERHRIAMKDETTRQRMSANAGMRRRENAIKISGERSVSRRPERRLNQSKFMIEHNPMKDPTVVHKVVLRLIGRIVSDCTRKRMSESQTGLHIREKNNNWKGGISFYPYCPKFNASKRERIRAEYEYKCVICGKSQSDNTSSKGIARKLSIHHIFYDKQEGCNGKDFFLVPLCMHCHSKTNWNRNFWENALIDITFARRFETILWLHRY